MSQNAPRPGRPPTTAPIRPANDAANGLLPGRNEAAPVLTGPGNEATTLRGLVMVPRTILAPHSRRDCVRQPGPRALRTAAVRQDARRARTPTEQQVNTITRVGILSGSEGEGSSPPVTDQPSFSSFWSEEMLSFFVTACHFLQKVRDILLDTAESQGKQPNLSGCFLIQGVLAVIPSLLSGQALSATQERFVRRARPFAALRVTVLRLTDRGSVTSCQGCRRARPFAALRVTGSISKCLARGNHS